MNEREKYVRDILKFISDRDNKEVKHTSNMTSEEWWDKYCTEYEEEMEKVVNILNPVRLPYDPMEF